MIDHDSSYTKDDSSPHWKICQLNYKYQFVDVLTAPVYTHFLAPDMRGCTHQLTTVDCFGQFQAWFCLLLHMIQDIADQFIHEGYLHACLNVLAYGTPFHYLPLKTHIFALDID
jgi:hypothetical protein